MSETIDRRRFGNTLTALACASALTAAAGAQWTLIDDFNDANDEGWTHHDLLAGTPWGPTIYDCSEFDYHIASTEPIPATTYVYTGSYWTDSVSNLLYSNGYLRAKIRADNVATHPALGMRWDHELLNGYAFAVNQDADIVAVLRLDAGEVTTLEFLPFVVDPGQDYILEARAIGTRLAVKIWAEGDPAPPAPQVELDDASYAAGAVGLFVGIVPGASPGRLSGRFDDVYFTVRPADVNGDSIVDVLDLLGVLAAWGPCHGCPEDINGDGVVDVLDLLAVLGDWD